MEHSYTFTPRARVTTIIDVNVFFARIYRGKNIYLYFKNIKKHIIVLYFYIEIIFMKIYFEIYFSTYFLVIFVYFELLGKKSYFSFCYMGFFQ